jgi:hypothetical protein
MRAPEKRDTICSASVSASDKRRKRVGYAPDGGQVQVAAPSLPLRITVGGTTSIHQGNIEITI